MKYQPYQGYHRKPWLGYTEPYYGHRIRTRSDWRFDRRPWHRPTGEALLGARGRARFPFWWRHSRNGGSVEEKRRAHRIFRRWAKHAVWRELDGDDAVSHRIVHCGDWLD